MTVYYHHLAEIAPDHLTVRGPTPREMVSYAKNLSRDARRAMEARVIEGTATDTEKTIVNFLKLTQGATAEITEN